MFVIGEFARHGRVSVRMLRHYDAIGLLEPMWIDPGTGYRFYDAGQLSRLNRIVALKNLGFTLQQVASMLDDQVSSAELRGMLKLRQAELQRQIATDTARLAQVRARLLAVSETTPMAPVVVKRIEPVQVDELTGTAAGPHEFDVVCLAEVPAAATLIHHGSMDKVLASIQALARWIDASGYQSLGYARELTLKLSDVRDDWVTELQEPVAPRQAA